MEFKPPNRFAEHNTISEQIFKVLIVVTWVLAKRRIYSFVFLVALHGAAAQPVEHAVV